MKTLDIALRWVFDKTKEYYLQLVILTVLGILISVFGISFAIVSKKLIDTASGQIQGSVITECIKLAILVLVQLILQVTLTRIHVITNTKLRMTLKNYLFGQLLNKNISETGKYHSGELINRINTDISLIADAVVEILPSGISLVVRVVLSYIVLFKLDSSFAVICLVALPLILIIARIYKDKIKILHKNCLLSDGKNRSFMQECLQNLLVIKAFGSQKKIIENSMDIQMINYNHTIKKNNVSIITNVLFFLSITAGYYFALAWGAYKISVGLMTFGTLTAILELVGQIESPIRNLSSLFPQYYSMIASVERVLEIENLPQDRIVNRNIDAKKFYEMMQEIKFDNVSFAYEQDEVLKNFNLSIAKGDIIALCGESGIGKSTVTKLLLGIIYPTKGDVYIYTNDGQKYILDVLTRDMFSYVPQGNMILSGTVRDNIAFGQNKIDDLSIQKCAQLAEIWDVICALPKELDTVLGEDGAGLSEGQIQRLAIARALYHDAPILIFDEATSSLDLPTEKKILKNIKDLGKTCIIISHRNEVKEICTKTFNI